ncbi:BCCT family transporter [Wukongibacter baidiensis]|uniref:BCCT family transporter n=1 Tax=Wukongibacter baidiensis TaxID=1723361 RepID=UPI003D7F56CC
MQNKLRLNKPLFTLAVAFTLGLSVIFTLFPEGSSKILGIMSDFAKGDLGSAFLWVGLAMFFMILWLSFSKIGRIKLGGDDEKPRFSTVSWLGMIFTAGTGSSVMYWGTIEWAYYFKGGGGSTPLGLVPGAWNTGEWSAAYGMFHEGLIAWSMYSLFGIAVAYIYFIKGKPVLRISEICRPVLKEKTDGIIGKAIDLTFMFGIIAGTATSMGFGTPMVSAGISKLFGIPDNTALTYIVIGIWAIMVAATLAFNLEKGIKLVSDINVWLLYIVLGVIFIFGPTRFIIDTFSSGLGIMASNFFRMSTWTDSIGQSSFPQWWTIFYWAWWLVYGPTVGIFLAKISKGRTIRELAIGGTLGGSVGCWVIYAVLGNFAMNLDITGVYSAADKIVGGSPGGSTIIEIISHAPLAVLILPTFILAAFFYSATSVNAIAYTLAATTTDNITPNQDPERWNRIFWVILLFGLSAALLSLGTLNVLKAASLITAIPLMVVSIIMMISLYKNIKNDGYLYTEYHKPSKVNK